MPWEIHLGHEETSFYWEGSTALAQVIQGGGGILDVL